MPLLSVAIITLNEEANLERTLASVAFADEIVVVDSGSTDRTVEIARAAGARVTERLWPGFSAQKNFAISQCTGTWVLSLDADEELSPELQRQMQTMLRSNPPADAYFLKRRNLFLGRWIKRGGFYPDPKLRLFRRSAANFEGTPQFEERPVHETITFDGVSDTLDFDLIHHAYPTLSSYIEHMDRYSNLGADLLAAKGRTSRSLPGFVAHVWIVPALAFLWNYIARLGFLDGREGLLLHLYHAVYTSWKYAKAWELAHQRTAPSSPSTAGQ
ncbi:MAG TPA: glycosyltransferase family 2 protein [Acidobacteriaceae bacterium]|jgi:glycosyltransferase involved in cell wall biosynthesis|nr:glycosyltransferase family 2 protein [Acidobacteriaceae bacterium]